MTGKQEYEQKINNKINTLLSKNGEYLKGYYNFIAMNKTLASAYQYCSYVAAFVNSVGKNVEEIDIEDCLAYVTNMAKTKSSSYAIASYSALKLLGLYLKTSPRYNISIDIMDGVSRPKAVETMETINKRNKGYLETSEIHEYLNTIENGIGNRRAKLLQNRFKSRDKLIAIIFLNTGMRCSAMMKLDVEDIDLDNMKLMVYDKGNKINTYELDKSLKEYFLEYLEDRKRILKGKEESALLITSHLDRISQAGIAKIVNKYAQFKGKNITPHKLRATYGTQVYKATGDLYFTQKCMKHNSPKVTELYIRGQDNNTSKASSIMCKLM